MVLQIVSGEQALTPSNLPVIIINTNGQTIVADPKITADMGIIFNGENVRNDVSDNMYGRILSAYLQVMMAK